jgi:hypothetical protein
MTLYIVLPDPENDTRGLSVSTIRVGVHWHIRILQAVIAVAAKDSALIGQAIAEELMKSLYYLWYSGYFQQVPLHGNFWDQRHTQHERSWTMTLITKTSRIYTSTTSETWMT